MIALAWRNLWRQRRRSLTTLGAVALVVALSILYYSMGGASKNSIYQNLTETLGHVQIHVDGYRGIRDAERLLIRDAEEVRGAAAATLDAELGAGASYDLVAALDVPGLLSGENRSRAVLLTGQDVDGAASARLAEELSAGRFLRADDVGAIVLGASLADALEVAVGDDVYAYAPGGEGFGAAGYRVVGLLDFDDPQREIAGAFVPLADARDLYAPGAASRFEVHLPEVRRVTEDDVSARLADALAAELPDLEVEAWSALDPLLAGALELIDPMVMAISVIFFVLAGLLVVNTVYLGLMERIREFGVIISLGAAGRRVMRMITLESVLLCAGGALVGTALGLLIVARLAQGFSIPGLEEYYASFGMNPVLYASVTPLQVTFAAVFALVTGVLAALWPASLAARLEPVEAMRFTA